jgi:hypothetical protein
MYLFNGRVGFFSVGLANVVLGIFEYGCGGFVGAFSLAEGRFSGTGGKFPVSLKIYCAIYQMLE